MNFTRHGEEKLKRLRLEVYRLTSTPRIADYLKRISEEDGMLDKKSVKVNLLDREAQNVKRMLEELLWARYKKLVKTITQNQTVASVNC